MASSSFLGAVINRRSYYQLSKDSTIPDDRIVHLVKVAIKHAPSAFNVQSARTIVLLGAQHDKFWTKMDEIVKGLVPEGVYSHHLKPRIEGFKGAHGSVMFFEDEADLLALQQNNPMTAAVVPEWSDHSSGMHQFIVWTAFETEGLGCSLQHYNLFPAVSEYVKEEWDVPATWKMKAQLVFGKLTGQPKEREYKPLEDRVRVLS